MKKTLIYFLALVVFYSCKKETDPPKAPPGHSRLAKIQNTDGTNQHAWMFDYDSEGRLLGHSYVENSQAPLPWAALYYVGNVMAVINRAQTTDDLWEFTEIKLKLDTEGKILKRTQETIKKYRGANIPQDWYFYDTLTYEYDAEGLLKKAVGGQFDSTWFNPNNLEIQSFRTQSVTNYTVTDGNFTNSVKTSNITGNGFQNGHWFSYTKTDEDTRTYEYTNLYPNKTDFSNTLYLNEQGFLPFLLNKKYKNMPDRISWSFISKDQNGNTLTSSNGVNNYTLEFDSEGYLSTIARNQGQPFEKLYFIYQ